MSDQTIAGIGRQLAVALRKYARDRRDDDKKEIARLQTQLCRETYNEGVDAQAALANAE